MLLDKIKMHQVRRTLKQVNKLGPVVARMSDTELQGQTPLLKKRLKNGASLEDVLPMAYAVVREADKRVLGLYPYDVQVMGAIVLNSGNIAEMKTGEGKTLTATMPLYLNALTGKGSILLTPNEYLAQRDEENLAPLYRWLGLTVSLGFVPEDETKDDVDVTVALRRKWYYSDILYTTSSTLAFDYLQNNLATSLDTQFMRPFNYALIDEVDAILLDGANSPFVIAGRPVVQSDLYGIADDFVKMLKRDEDFVYKKRKHIVYLTYQGYQKAKRAFRIPALYKTPQRELYRHIALALRAHYLMKKGRDYLVVHGKVILLDETNGRLMKGVQVNTGIHQAVEAKEHVDLTQTQLAIASITYQSLFGLFNKIAGMSGTAKTDENEFINVYKMRVYQIPTNRPDRRKDLPARYYLTTAEKLHEAIKETIRLHKIGRPVLLVAGSVENSEIISELLLNQGIAHNVLNAFNSAKEAAIVADAGQRGAVTVATNMAGRGTDIKLGKGIAELGGLAVIGTELLSERIKLQLAGRAGRQGDPGSSLFFVSIEDSMIASHSTSRLQRFYRRRLRRRKKHHITTAQRIRGPLIHLSIAMLKNRVADAGETARENSSNYETSMRIQRNYVYHLRQQLMMMDHLESLVGEYLASGFDYYLSKRDHWTKANVQKLINDHVSFEKIDVPDAVLGDKEKLKQYLESLCRQLLNKKFKILINSKQLNQFYRTCLLHALDDSWTGEVAKLEELKQTTKPMANIQRSEQFVYREAALESFKKMLKQSEIQSVDSLMLSTISVNDDGELIVSFD